MTPEEIQTKKQELISDILSPSTSIQLKMASLDALWTLAKVEAINEWKEKQKEPNY
jgi:hypothetical protein